MSKKHKHQHLTHPPASPQQPRVTVQQAQFAGPLPPPEAFQRYELVLPGAAERILAMAERQAEHRQGLEARVIKSNVTGERIGQVFGLVIALAAIAAG
jgi:uncharacterized membrane protein